MLFFTPRIIAGFAREFSRTKGARRIDIVAVGQRSIAGFDCVVEVGVKPVGFERAERRSIGDVMWGWGRVAVEEGLSSSFVAGLYRLCLDHWVSFG